MKSLYNLVGMRHHPNAEILLREVEDEEGIVVLRREPDNKFDHNAIQALVFFVADSSNSPYEGTIVGYVKREQAVILAKKMDDAKVTTLNAKIVRNYGSYVEIEVEDPKPETAT